MVKNPRDLIIEDTNLKPGTTMSLASYWLTAEGLDNPIYFELIKLCIGGLADEVVIDVFDGATKEDVSEHLRQWELCFMPYWGSKHLVNAICSGTYRDGELALDSIELAQEKKELPKVFTPKQGVLWAMNNGYLFTSSIRHWVNVNKKEYAPYSILNDLEREESAWGEADVDFKASVRGLIEQVISIFPEATSKDIISHCFSCYSSNNRKKGMLKEIMGAMNIEMDKSAGKRSQKSIDYLKNAPTYKKHLS